VNQLWNMLELAELILVCGRLRDESRGSHYKPTSRSPEPKEKDPTKDPQWMEGWRKRNESWLKLTMARFSPEGAKVPSSHEEPRQSHPEAGADGGTPMVDEIVMRIERRDGPDAPARWEEFKVPNRPNANVISVLMEIQRIP